MISLQDTGSDWAIKTRNCRQASTTGRRGLAGPDQIVARSQKNRADQRPARLSPTHPQVTPLWPQMPCCLTLATSSNWHHAAHECGLHHAAEERLAVKITHLQILSTGGGAKQRDFRAKIRKRGCSPQLRGHLHTATTYGKPIQTRNRYSIPRETPPPRMRRRVWDASEICLRYGG